jgi:CheY-like chemotaxis protein
MEIDGIAMAISISDRSDKYIPTAIVTGSLSKQIQEDAQQAGFWVLQKPVAPLQLRSILLALEVSRKDQPILAG